MEQNKPSYDPKHNPYTTITGVGFFIISFMMGLIQWVLPAFIVLKKDMGYPWYAPLIPLAIGVLLIFMNDEYFAKIFSRGDKIIAKRTDTDKK